MTQEKAQERSTPAGLDTPLEDALVRARRFFTRSTVSDDLRTLSK